MATDERKKQMDYWMEHSSELTVEEMLLDSQAKLLDKEERPEVLAMLPSYKDKDIIELGAGIGRFTGELAKHARHVIAMDFMKHVIEKNKEINKHHKNVDFWCADVTTELDIVPASADLVFSNWLLMYLADEEVKQLARRMLNWVKIGGHLFFRESCFHQSGDHKRKNNPTHYREPRYYNKIFEEVFNKEEDGTYTRWRLVLCKCVGAYVRAKKNQNQICWIWTKVSCECPDETDFQKFLDSVQYTETGILRYERIFGEGFVSTGGLDTTKEFVEILNLQAGQKVLDVGCGIGGGDFYMAEEFDVEVLGLDLSVNMASIALERAIGRQCAVEFEVGDVTTVEFPDCSFDVIYSRDTILHIQDKPSLFERFYGWLKPGGRILISDYCKSELPPSQEFESYIKQRGYDLHDVQRYGQMLRNAGFVDVVAEDRTDQFVEILRNELSRTENVKDEFVHDFSEEDYNAIIAGWTSKMKRCGAGEQKWGLFYGCKPL